ncbi:methyltransferase domain-containing protein [Colletotrichum tofieldiae]|uniref:Methyltransferase domain-containing protein n=1 Tax=Colletotrichum tofieldiae TaxID=708197 RepID=A0A166S6N3_9PEZI|nr:methyltransferase domain-containing protein [Colletotrichum tofieldiae]GKT75059.1 methyltransferase domain-containing protein [Colletotrichum tofieldiae]
MAGSLQDWRGFVAQAFEHFGPGGYLEDHDNLYPLKCHDSTLKGDSALFQWSRYMVEATDKLSRPITIVSQIPKILEDVVVAKQKMPASPWAKDLSLRELGNWTQAFLLPGIEGLCLTLFTRILAWKPAKVLVFCANVRKDARNLGIHAC